MNHYNSKQDMVGLCFIDKEKVRLRNKNSHIANDKLKYYQERQNRLVDADDLI